MQSVIENLSMNPYTIADSEYFWLSLTEPAKGRYAIHCEVYQWSKEIYKWLFESWQEIIEQFYVNGIDEVYCFIDEEATKIKKFAIMFGFEPELGCEYKTEDGQEGTLVLFRFPIKETIEGN